MVFRNMADVSIYFHATYRLNFILRLSRKKKRAGVYIRVVVNISPSEENVSTKTFPELKMVHA